MKIAVTGAMGLIGTEMTKLLDKNKIEWIGLSRSVSHGSYVATDYSVASLAKIFADVDIVVHLAAIRGRDSKNGYQDYVANEILTENLLKAMEQSSPKRVIFLSSISVYSDLELLPWKENLRPNPASFYGLSKLVCEYLCGRYRERGIESVIFRCAHVLGLEESGYMISKFLNSAAKGETLQVTGMSVAKREFIYVKDVARAILYAIKTPEILGGGVWNLGCGEGTTNLCLAEEINSCFGNEGNLEYQDLGDEGISDSYMDVTKLKQTKFKLKYTLRAAIEDIRKDNFLS